MFIGDVLGFLHIYNPAKKQSVITVRGTVPSRATDILQDFDLFKEITVLQAMSYFFPIFKVCNLYQRPSEVTSVLD